MYEDTRKGILFIGIIAIIILSIFCIKECSSLNNEIKEHQEKYTCSADSLPCDSLLISETPIVSLKLDTIYRWVGTHTLTIGDYKFADDDGMRDYETDALYGAEFFLRTSEEISVIKDFIKTYGKCVEKLYNISFTLYDDGDFGILYAEDIAIKNGLSDLKRKIETEKQEENMRKANEMKRKMFQ